MEYIRYFDSQEDYETFISSLTEDQTVLVGGPESVYMQVGKPIPIDYSKVAMFFENVDDKEVTIGVKKNNASAYTATLETSMDGETWEEWGSTSTTELTRTVGVGGKLYIRASDNVGYFNIDYNYNYFSSSGEVNVCGNIMSLGYKDFEDKTSMTVSYAYRYIFYHMTNLVDASKLLLPATTLSYGCYQHMFQDCTSLIEAPEILPATTLASYCYNNMFKGCTSLTKAPELPATALANCCYQFMFTGCTSLIEAPEILPATTLAIYCYAYMFNGCSSLTAAPALPAETLASSCYNGMFYGCSSLTAAPALPATTLTDNCYTEMFYGCSSLNYIKAMFTNSPRTSYTNSWVSSVSSTGTFVKNTNATWGDVRGVNGIPSGWTVETATA